MPWGKKSVAHNQKGMSKKEKQAENSTDRAINQEAKRRLQQERPATSEDGNRRDR